MYGSEAMGGVVSIRTRRGRGQPAGFFAYEGGSFGTNREILGFSGGDDRLDFALTASRYRTAGELERSAYRADELVGRFGLELTPRARLGATLYLGDSKTELPLALDTRWGEPIMFDVKQWKLANVSGEMRNQGFEYELAFDLGAGFVFRGAFTHRDRELPSGPEIGIQNYGSVGLSWERAGWLVSLDGFYSGAMANARREFPSPDPEERKQPGRRNLWTLTARYRASVWFPQVRVATISARPETSRAATTRESQASLAPAIRSSFSARSQSRAAFFSLAAR